MDTELKPIRSEADYEEALAEVERLWGAQVGTSETPIPFGHHGA